MRARWVPLIATLLLAAACGSGDSEPTAATTTAAPTVAPAPTTATTVPTTTVPATTTTVPATTTTVVDEEAAVIAAYLAYWDAFFAVTNPGQPDSPLIDQVATGEAAERLREVAADRLATNTAYRVPETSLTEHQVTIVDLTGGVATVRDCFVDDSYRQDLGTGATGDNELETNLITATLTYEDGRWRISGVPTLLRQWPGATPCEQ